MEDALGSFYVPTRIISDEVLMQFRDQISRLARRFFHHLLRYHLGLFSSIHCSCEWTIWSYDDKRELVIL